MSFFDQLADNITKVTKDLGSKAQELTETARLNGKINDANNLIKSTYTAIGETYYQLHKDDADPQMADQFRIIAEAMKSVEECKAQINAIKGVHICQECGAEVVNSAVFCPKCGARIEVPKAAETEEAAEEAPQKKCSVCGEPLEEDAMFCTGCGTPVPQEDSPEDQQ